MTYGHISRYRSELMGVFCLWIMAFHSKYVVTCPKALAPIWQIVLRGNAGVDAFLIVSGIGLYYAYTKLMATEPRAGWRLRTFYTRRFVRLFFPYLFIAVPYFVWAAWSRGEGVKRFVMDFFQISLPMKGDQAAWYMAAVAVFYLLFPLIFRLQENPVSLRGKPVSRNAVTGWLILAATVVCWLLMKFTPTFYKHSEILLTRFPAFILGCGIGKQVRENRPLPSWAVLGAGVFLFIYTYVLGPSLTLTLWFRLSCAPFALAAILVFAWMFWKLDRFEKTRAVFRFIGDRSLELYLTHGLIRLVWQWYLPDKLWDKWGVLSYLCILLIAFVISVICHPIIQWIASKLLGGRPKPAAG